jgi:hypothetical protein
VVGNERSSCETLCSATRKAAMNPTTNVLLCRLGMMNAHFPAL